MELISLIYLKDLVASQAFFYLKIAFIFLLLIINLYLIFSHEKEPINSTNKETPILQSGFGSKNLKSFFTKIATFGGFLSALITVKNELKNTQIGKLDQLMETEREEIRRSIDKDREGHQKILESIDSKRDELFKLHTEKAKIFAHNDRLLILHNSIKNKVESYIDKFAESSTKLSELGILDQIIQLETKRLGEEMNSFLNLDDPLESSPPTPPKGEEQDIIENLKDLKESSIFDFNILTGSFASKIDWFEGLSGIKKIAVSMILGKSVVFSALTSIIFIFYGNILIEKYDLENRYPKLAKIIQLRQKFQKYYFKYNCYLIFSIIITEISFALAVLF